MITIPQRLIEDEVVEVLATDGQSFLIKKSLDQSLQGRNAYLSLPALNLVLKGQQLIRDYDGRQWSIAAGELVFMPKGLYTINDLIAENDHYTSLIFFIHPKRIQYFLAQIKFRPSIKPAASENGLCKLKLSTELKIFYDTLPQLMSIQQSFKGQFLQIKMLELLHLLLHHKHGNSLMESISQMDQRPKRDLPQFMRAHFHHPFTLNDYAALTGRSLSTFRRDFKRYFQSNPHHWLRQERLKKAKTMLESQSDLLVADTAYQVGYENVSHFIKAFKNAFGQTPNAFKEAIHSSSL